MKIIIAGAGEVGMHLAKMLSKDDQDITLIDSDQSRLDKIDSNYNLMTWNGSTSSIESLKDVGVEDTDLYIAVTPYETRNITSCAIAKRLGAKKTVARIDNSEFLNPDNGQLIKDIGADYLIYPENVAATEMALALAHNWARSWHELHNGRMLLIGVKVRSNSELIGVKFKDLPQKCRDFHVAAIKRRGELIIPDGNTSIEPEDIVYFITPPESTETVREMCGKKKHDINKVLVMGGSRIARRFARLYSDKFHIKILDKDMATCEELATMFPGCEIVCGDGRDIEVLVENNISQYDAFMALTDSPETNILTCMTAKEFGVPKTLADVENLQFFGQAESLDIGTVINKKLLASSRIYKILLDADETNSRFFALPDAEVAEILVKPDAKITRSVVKHLHLPPGMTLASLVRGNRAMLINGDTQILPGDYVVVFSLMGTLKKLEKWFG